MKGISSVVGKRLLKASDKYKTTTQNVILRVGYRSQLILWIRRQGFSKALKLYSSFRLFTTLLFDEMKVRGWAGISERYRMIS